MSTFQISSSVRPLTTKPCIVLLDVLTRQVYFAWHISLTSWLGRYIDPVTLTYMYILHSSAVYTFYIDIQYLLNYKAYTTKSCIELLVNVRTAGSLIGDLDLYFAIHWLKPFTSIFHMSSTLRPSATKPCIVMYLLGQYLDLVTLTYILHSSAFDTFLHWCSISPQI